MSCIQKSNGKWYAPLNYLLKWIEFDDWSTCNAANQGEYASNTKKKEEWGAGVYRYPSPDDKVPGTTTPPTTKKKTTTKIKEKVADVLPSFDWFFGLYPEENNEDTGGGSKNNFGLIILAIIAILVVYFMFIKKK